MFITQSRKQIALRAFMYLKKVFSSKKVKCKHNYIISHIAAPDKVFKAEIIFYLSLNVFNHSSGPLEQKFCQNGH